MRRSKEKSEARSLVYDILALVIVQGHLAGSRPTVLAPPPSVSPLSGEETHSTPPIIRRPLYDRQLRLSNPLIGNQSANTEQLPTPPSSPRPLVRKF
jgi:hypothetical protein